MKETKLEKIFSKMLKEIQNDTKSEALYDICSENSLWLVMHFNFNEMYRFLHTATKSDNPSEVCHYVFGNQYFSYNDFNYLKFTPKHIEQLQEFLDMYEKDGFKFKVSKTSPVALLWCKDNKIINKNNFDEINTRIKNG